MLTGQKVGIFNRAAAVHDWAAPAQLCTFRAARPFRRIHTTAEGARKKRKEAVALHANETFPLFYVISSTFFFLHFILLCDGLGNWTE